MDEAIGGYFEMELNRGNHPYPGAGAFNSARSAFQAVLLARKTRRVFLPHFICSVMTDAANAVDVEVTRYGLNDALELPEPPEVQFNEQLLYVDYFGLKRAYIQNTLALRYRDKLIVDNAQALFSLPVTGIATLYSPRKFVGVPDGGWLVNGPTNVERPSPGTSSHRLDALIGRLIDGPEAHYSAFQRTEEALGLEGLKGMSASTVRLLDSIDYTDIKTRRIENLRQLHGALHAINHFSAWPPVPIPALCYPLLLESADAAQALRHRLLANRIYVPSYWRELIDSQTTPALEKQLSERLLPLPIDQRYGQQDINRLAAVILKYFGHHPTESDQ
ncbi:MAG TPA: hypothetical protein VGC62_23205 [Pseudomonas sp.]|uniref:hypothetical protein n=1 Tax=Pseudomonas sp. TaxID=306 RepID=UPI002EDA1FE2